MKGMVHTVLGPVAPEDLGRTSTHEHFLLDFTLVFAPPTAAGEQFRAYEPVTMENLGWVNYDPMRSYDNLITIDENEAIQEGILFRRAGGKTIVDTTSVGINRDPLALARISRATGVNVVMGSGYYIGMVHPNNMDDKTETEIADEIISDIRKGVGGSGIKSGIIGELGCSLPLSPNERKVLRAGAQAQQETGAAITIHPGRADAAPFEIIEVLNEAGADVSRVVMGHIDRTIFDLDTLLRLAGLGCYLEYDFFGWEISQFSLSERDMPNDGMRLEFIMELVNHGYGNKVVIAQDMFGKHRKVKYGGHGFAHIMENIAPRLEDKLGSTDAAERILTWNPAELLAFV